VPAPLGQQRLPNPPDDGESPAHLQVLPTQVHPNNALASQLSHAHAESPHLWMSENAQDYYQRLHSLVSGPATSKHLSSPTLVHLVYRSYTRPV
jgi:hypothetical protein